MRKLIVSMMVSLDGYMEGENNDLNWHVWDEEMEKYMTGFIKTTDTFIYGRISYELMLQYWPLAKGPFADLMNEMPKIVLSGSLKKGEWNAKIVHENIGQQMMQLKQQPGKDIVLFAGAETLSTFMQMGLVDEYRLIVNPVVLGKGTPLFKNIEEQLSLKFVRAQPFSCGNTILYYEPTVIKREQLINILEYTGKDLLQTLAGYTREQINIVPFTGSWTAGQVAEHLLKSIAGIPELLTGATKPTERPINEKATVLQTIFLDFSTKMKSPDFILPSNGPHEKDTLITSFEKTISEISRTAAVVNLSETCTGFSFPQLRELTRLEWIWFGICHSKRHTRQLKNIYKQITKAKD